MDDRDAQDGKTEVSDAHWCAPVQQRMDLPDVGEEGQCCYVRDESAVYAFRSGAWVKEIARTP